MVRNHKIVMMGGSVVAGAAALAMAAEALLWSSVHSPRAPDTQSYLATSSWMIRATGGGEDTEPRAGGLGTPDPAGRRGGTLGDEAGAGRAAGGGQTGR